VSKSNYQSRPPLGLFVSGLTQAVMAWLVVSQLAAVGPTDVAEKRPPAEPFVDGDRVCWVGDSITAAARYHSLVRLFYDTRYPDREIDYHNCGFGGDTATMIMSPVTKRFRFEQDILSRRPTVAVVMLGMNDLALKGYTDLEGAPEERQHLALSSYEKHMEKLIQELAGSGSRIILVQPSIYDATAVFDGTPDKYEGAQARLGFGAEKIRAWSRLYRTGLVDFYHPMTALNAGQQTKDPSFSIVGKDRIHPGPTGHFVMAYLFLKDTGMSPTVADIALDAETATVLSSGNCDITGLEASKEQITFTYTAKALPFPVAKEYTPALNLVPFTEELNQETLKITNLPDGLWSLAIDGENCGKYRGSELASGINLAGNVNTPQYRQAAKILELSTERQNLEGLLRQADNLRYYHAKQGLCPVENAEEVRKIMRSKLEVQKKAPQPDVGRIRILEICADPEAEADLRRKIEVIGREIRAVAVPQPRTFDLRLVTKS
jgi:lysophospholipase L1-like esterase